MKSEPKMILKIISGGVLSPAEGGRGDGARSKAACAILVYRLSQLV